jgi:hypothetical protein
MNPADAAELLAVAATFDKRTVGDFEARAWAKALTGLDPRDCAAAIENHYTNTPEWLMPAHVRAEVRRIRNERLRAAGNAEPPYDRDDVLGGLRAIRAARKAIGDGGPAETTPAINQAGVERLDRMLNAAIDRLPKMPELPPGESA